VNLSLALAIESLTAVNNFVAAATFLYFQDSFRMAIVVESLFLKFVRLK